MSIRSSKMKAVRMHRYGGAEVVVIEHVEVPEPGPGEVLVAGHMAGVNPIDWKIREGHMSHVLPLALPYTFGCELEGTVASVGEGVTGFAPGDRVYGFPNLLRAGTYAEYTLMNASEIAHVPETLPKGEAATLPVAVMTAQDGLMLHGQLLAGERVLILGGAGGVGSAAVQLATALGAEVFATTSARNEDWVRSLGAETIDYVTQRPAEVLDSVDLVFDTVGGDSALDALGTLKLGGRFVSSNFMMPPKDALESLQARAAVYGIAPSGERLLEINKLVDAGNLRMRIDSVFPMHAASDALESSRSGRTRGKLLLEITPN